MAREMNLAPRTMNCIINKIGTWGYQMKKTGQCLIVTLKENREKKVTMPVVVVQERALQRNPLYSWKNFYCGGNFQ
jgi:hypothetical protein